MLTATDRKQQKSQKGDVTQGPDLQHFLRLITILPELRSTFLGMTDLQHRKIVLDSDHKLAYDFPKRHP